MGRSHRQTGHTGKQVTQASRSLRGQVTQADRTHKWASHTEGQVTQEDRSHRKAGHTEGKVT